MTSFIFKQKKNYITPVLYRAFVSLFKCSGQRPSQLSMLDATLLAPQAWPPAIPNAAMLPQLKYRQTKLQNHRQTALL